MKKGDPKAISPIPEINLTSTDVSALSFASSLTPWASASKHWKVGGNSTPSKVCFPFELNWLNSLFCLWVPIHQLLLTSAFLSSRVYEMEENKHSELYSLFFFFSLLYHFQAASLVLYSVWSQYSVRFRTYYRTYLKHLLYSLTQNTFSHANVRKQWMI